MNCIHSTTSILMNFYNFCTFSHKLFWQSLSIFYTDSALVSHKNPMDITWIYHLAISAWFFFKGFLVSLPSAHLTWFKLRCRNSVISFWLRPPFYEDSQAESFIQNLQYLSQFLFSYISIFSILAKFYHNKNLIIK